MNRSETVILVTGATGRQGGAVARHLLDDGFTVRAFVREPDAPPARTLAQLGAQLTSTTHRPSMPRSTARMGCSACKAGSPTE